MVSANFDKHYLPSIHNYVSCVAPSGPPQSITAGALNALSIEINWLPPLLPDQNGQITGYVINITSLDTGIRQQFTSVNTTLQVHSLTPYTNYICIVAARTAVGVGPFSTVINVQTPESGITGNF